MSDLEQKKIFANNLTHYLSINNKQQNEVAKAIGVKPTTFNTWCVGKSMPSMGKIQKLADYFGVGKSALTDRQPTDKPDETFYYITKNINDNDERFRKLIMAYYLLSREEKDLICDFFETFIMNKKNKS